eukprot:1156390-Pelagomonas_calceolata.AAC.7
MSLTKRVRPPSRVHVPHRVCVRIAFFAVASATGASWPRPPTQQKYLQKVLRNPELWQTFGKLNARKTGEQCDPAP